MLQVDHSGHSPTAQDWNRQECFIAIFRQFIKELEASVIGGAFRYSYRLFMLRHPTGDSLAHVQPQMIDDFRVRIL